MFNFTIKNTAKNALRLSLILVVFILSCGKPIPGPQGPKGQPGLSGSDGKDGTAVKIVDPCGDYPGKPDEIVILTSDDQYLAWYVDVGMTVLEEGVNYQTTDKQKCNFMIQNGEVIEL